MITNAYASTAKSLSQIHAPGREVFPSDETAVSSDLKAAANSNANGDQKTNGEADGMDVDVEMDGEGDNANSGENSDKNLDQGLALDEQALNMIERRRGGFNCSLSKHGADVQERNIGVYFKRIHRHRGGFT